MSRTRHQIRTAAMRLFTERGSTQLTVQELARAAEVARGTVYKHVDSIEHLFHELAAELTEEMSARVIETLRAQEDPARRLHLGMQGFLLRAHQEPEWGRFLVRFSLGEPSLSVLWAGPVHDELARGVATGRFGIAAERVPFLLVLLAGSTLSSMLAVLEGHHTWRTASTELGRFALRGLGLGEADIAAVVEPQP